MNRRGFIKGLAALAALASAPGLPVIQARAETAAFMAAASTGEVIGKTFYIDGPVTLTGLQNLIIYNCRFVVRNLKPDDPIVRINDCRNVHIHTCTFDAA